jgi:hypothetical protein
MLVKLHIQGLGISWFAEQTDTNHLEEKAFLSCDDVWERLPNDAMKFLWRLKLASLCPEAIYFLWFCTKHKLQPSWVQNCHWTCNEHPKLSPHSLAKDFSFASCQNLLVQHSDSHIAYLKNPEKLGTQLKAQKEEWFQTSLIPVGPMWPC